MQVHILPPESSIHATISLPASKSISNRALIIRALTGSEFEINNLSDADDTTVLCTLLSDNSTTLNCGEGGTTLRFILAFLAAKGGEYTVTAAPALISRPITPLLEALTALGCEFTFLEAENRLPLQMRSSGLHSHGEINVPGDISSQFISALMLVGPYIENGITIRVAGEWISAPYVHMTAHIMEQFGIKPHISDDFIRVLPGKYRPAPFKVESDWSAATYWYEIVALRQGSEVFLPGLSLHSVQGDAVISAMMSELGIVTTGSGSGIRIRSGNFTAPQLFIRDLHQCPDVAPALIASCSGLNITADFPGLKNFRLKETDRAAAFQRELYNFSVNTDFCGGSKFKVYHGPGIRHSSRIIKTYRDHRVAMAIAPLSLVAGAVTLDDASVVSKSYPGFFNDLKSAGFDITYS
jgi:3-phosphoshikimate 1-carboxyvinyltransferase